MSPSGHSGSLAKATRHALRRAAGGPETLAALLDPVAADAAAGSLAHVELLVWAVDELRLTIGDETVDLAAGDSVYFAADSAHGYANTTTEPCTYHVAALTMRPRIPSHRPVPG